MNHLSDLFIIGGGIHGVAIAADAAGRGLKVTLCEKNDLASATSSASSKLIHGGLRYLEFYDFRLVKKALHEREVLLFRAPFLVHPLQFILPHEKHLRPAWMIRLGLFLYDHLSKRKLLPKSKPINLKHHELLPHLHKGFSYYDCFTDDSRLVILNALSAKEHGATILTRTEFLSADYENNQWKITLKNNDTISYHYAKVIMNATGPWVKETQSRLTGLDLTCDITLDKGSHIVVPKLYEGDFAYILQNTDQRIVFTIPYFDQYTLIGTTDVHYTNDLNHIAIDSQEEAYLCEIVNRYFKKHISKKDIAWSYSGVRCLQKQTGHKDFNTTRDFDYIINKNSFAIIGGKLTTHRLLAEKVVNELKTFFPHLKSAWTANQPLPGGDIKDFSQFCIDLKNTYAWLPEKLLLRYAKSYGNKVITLLHNSHNIKDLGIDFSHGLYQKEVEYLIQHEWAMTVEDILWRRTKLGLQFASDNIHKLQVWLQNNDYLFKNSC